MLRGGVVRKLNCFFLSSLKYQAVKINSDVRRLLMHFFFWKILHGLLWYLYKDTCFPKFILQIQYAQCDSGLQQNTVQK